MGKRIDANFVNVCTVDCRHPMSRAAGILRILVVRAYLVAIIFPPDWNMVKLCAKKWWRQVLVPTFPYVPAVLSTV